MEKRPIYRILHVDDVPETLEATKINLHRLGYEVVSACSANEALALVEEQPFDVALIDIFMPGMNGIELLRKLRESQPDLATIMMTGASGASELFDSVLAGCDGYLEKPCTPIDIVKLIQHVMKDVRGG